MVLAHECMRDTQRPLIAAIIGLVSLDSSESSRLSIWSMPARLT